MKGETERTDWRDYGNGVWSSKSAKKKLRRGIEGATRSWAKNREIPFRQRRRD